MWLFKSATAAIELLGVEGRKTVEVSAEKGTQKLYIYTGNEPVKGRVKVDVKKGDTIEHQGMRVDFIGQIEMFYDRGNHYEFVSVTQALAPPGSITGQQSFDFEFPNPEKPYESYNGINVRVR
jgi:vacuolar protein sorting-associated protein 26